MKILRVSGCHDCSYKFSVVTALPNIYCGHPKMNDMIITEYVDTKSLPDECQLEDELPYTYKSGVSI